MELKDVLGEIESDGANLVHGRLLKWALTPPLWHAEAVGGRPHHQARSRERSASRAGHREQAAGPVSQGKGGDRSGSLRARSRRLEDPAPPWVALQRGACARVICSDGRFRLVIDMAPL